RVCAASQSSSAACSVGTTAEASAARERSPETTTSRPSRPCFRDASFMCTILAHVPAKWTPVRRKRTCATQDPTAISERIDNQIRFLSTENGCRANWQSRNTPMSLTPVSTRIIDRNGQRIAQITVERAHKLNVLDRPAIAALTEAATALQADAELRAVVLTGAESRAFIGGADIPTMAALDAAGAEAFITALHRAIAALRKIPVPVIARINGYCLGAGMEIAVGCDLRVASDNAAFGMPEVRVGIPSVIEAA